MNPIMARRCRASPTVPLETLSSSARETSASLSRGYFKPRRISFLRLRATASTRVGLAAPESVPSHRTSFIIDDTPSLFAIWSTALRSAFDAVALFFLTEATAIGCYPADAVLREGGAG